MSKIVLCSLLVAIVAGSSARGGDAPSPLASLVAAERAFAKRATDVSTREAFVAYFASDSTLMRPGPVNAQQWFVANPKWGLEGLLTWDPSFALVSAAGDVGLSTGPWQFRPERKPETKPVAQGFFVTVWVETPNGWRVKFDHGVGTPEPSSPVAPFDATSARNEAWPIAKADQGAARSSLEAAEASFERAFASGPASAYDTALAPEGRVYRPDHFPAVGAAEARALVTAVPTPGLTFRRSEIGVARSVDVAYVYGTVEPTAPVAGSQPGTFLRVWKRGADTTWRLALDLVDPPTTSKAP